MTNQKLQKGLTRLVIGSVLLGSIPAQAQNLFDFIFNGGRPQAPQYQQQYQPQYQQQYNQVQAPPVQRNLPAGGEWLLTKTAWTAEDEANYSNFVRAMGRSGCRTVESCMRGAWNPYRSSDPSPQEYKFWSDCADWPYFLRTYFAWKNGLPMAISQGMVQLPLTAEQQKTIDDGTQKAQTDVRYSWNGNKPSRRLRLPYDNGQATNFFQIHTTVQNSIHTASLRVDPRTNFGDLYSPAIRPGAIRPGTVVYDPSGHVGVVYDITPDGQVMVFDALIDNKSISPRRPYSSDFYKRSRLSHGSWLANFRPVVIEGASYDQYSRSYVGGRMRVLSNQEIPDFSLEMFGTTTSSDGRSAYVVDGKTTNSFQEFLRRRMFTGRYQLDVINEFKIRMKLICDDFGSRISLVQDATIKGVALQPHVDVLPNTIYGGHGDWDLYSTPGGDVRRRNSVNSAVEYAKELKGHVDRGNQEYGYSGNDLKADMIKAAKDTLNSCAITYKNSAGKNVKVSLDNLLRRMPYMSFSPWHCVELRWGATSREELATCPDLNDPVKARWYKAQQTLRNQMARDTNIFTGYSLDELEQKAPSLGPARAENFNLIQRMETAL